MLKVTSLCKSFGAQPVLQDISLVLNSGQRAGLIGPNGAGKSTLLRVLCGDLLPDSGTIHLDPGERVAYLPQYPQDLLNLTLREALLQGAGRAGQLQSQIIELERAMSGASAAQLDVLLADYAAARDEFDRLGGYDLDVRLDAVMRGLGLDMAADFSVAALSGGNKTKLSLARLLMSDADVVLLDEPTNYLDLPALLWLERFVVEGRRSYVIVSHDRLFLDRTVESVLALDPATHSVRRWPGTYSAYAEALRREEHKKLEAYRDQQEEIARIKEDIRQTQEQAQQVESRTQRDYKGDTRFALGAAKVRAAKVARKAKVRERKLERTLESPDLLEKPRGSWRLHLDDVGREPIDDNRLVLQIDHLCAGYDGKQVLHDVSLELRGRDRLALVGGNGSGKTTLLRCVSGQMPYEGSIRIGGRVRMGVLSQEGRELPLDSSVLAALRARTQIAEGEARTYLHRFLFTGTEVFKPVAALSYGQRSKLALAILILSNANFLVLDEPTSHLDMPSLEAMEEALAQYRGPLLVVSHDRYFMQKLGLTRTEVMDGGALHAVDTLDTYEEAWRDENRSPSGVTHSWRSDDGSR